MRQAEYRVSSAVHRMHRCGAVHSESSRHRRSDCPSSGTCATQATSIATAAKTHAEGAPEHIGRCILHGAGIASCRR